MSESAAHPYSASARSVRALLTCLLALALVSGPALGLGMAGQDEATRDAAELGVIAGVVPLAADPGHRMGGASAASNAPHTHHAIPATAATVAGIAFLVQASGHGAWAHHAWLARMLIGARLQTDGG